MGKFDIIHDKEIVQKYLVDESNFYGSAEGLFIPSNTNELKEFLKYSYAHSIPLTITANRTSLTGSSIAESGYIISLEKIFFEPYKEEDIFFFPPYYNYAEAQQYIYNNGFYLPVDPTSAPDCTLSGAVATNASGAKTYKYGSIRNFVHIIELLTINGTFLKVRRGEFLLKNRKVKINGKELYIPYYKFNYLIKNTAGYYNSLNLDLIDLFIGSEGTLGIFTKIGIKPLKGPPRTIQFLIPVFKEKDIYLYWQIFQNFQKKYKVLSSMEYFDNFSLELLKEPPIEINSKCGFFWLELELLKDESLDLFIDYIEKYSINSDFIYVAEKESEKEKIKKLRHAIPEEINTYIKRNNFQKLGIDYSVSPDNFKFLLEKYLYFQKKMDIPVIIFGHIGNQNLHVNFLPRTQKEYNLATRVIDELADLVISLNGTLSSEHGIGKKKKNLLKKMYSENTLKKMKTIKKSFDDKFLLNKGNLFEYE